MEIFATTSALAWPSLDVGRGFSDVGDLFVKLSDLSVELSLSGIQSSYGVTIAVELLAKIRQVVGGGEAEEMVEAC